MKLLILTQKVDNNDEVLGFFHRWLEEFAKHCERVSVLALEVGDHHLPSNVSVYSLGKEQGASRWKYLFRFYRVLWQQRQEYECVFIHMNPIYAILGGWCWYFLHKKIALWYTHKQVDCKLRLAEKIVGKIFTASAKSFRLPSKKMLVTGHGIDTEEFALRPRLPQEGFCIMTTGRLSSIKDYETLLAAVKILHDQGHDFSLVLVGGAITDVDRVYVARLRQYVEEHRLQSRVVFRGALSHRLLPSELVKADVFVSLSKTGSVDKAVLEAMAIGLPVITSNEAFQEVLGSDWDTLHVPPGDPYVLAKKIGSIATLPSIEREAIGERLHDLVVRSHDLRQLIPFIVHAYDTFS